jgi:hypothetical protein
MTEPIDVGPIDVGIREVAGRVPRLTVGSASTDGAGLVHLIRVREKRSMCGAFGLGDLTTRGPLGDEVCPACLEHLRTTWVIP